MTSLSTVVTSDPPIGCRFLNPVHDAMAEAALLDYYRASTAFRFTEKTFFQSQCLLCDATNGQLCVGYNGGTLYGVTSSSVNAVRLVAGLPYIYALGENVGASVATVDAVWALREDLVISYQTLSRFKVTLFECCKV